VHFLTKKKIIMSQQNTALPPENIIIEDKKQDYNNKNKTFFITKLKLLLILFALFVVGTKLFEISKQRETKKEREIEGILKKSFNDKICEQYALVAKLNGSYPCYKNIGIDSIFLLKGEVWKYGKTCLGQDKRYNDLDEKKLDYIPQFMGNEQECLIEEKRKIYNYPLLLECIKRKIKLLRPPGNKIDR